MITVLARQQSWQRQQSFGRDIADLHGGASAEEELPVAKPDSPAVEAMKHVVSFVKAGDTVPSQVRRAHAHPLPQLPPPPPPARPICPCPPSKPTPCAPVPGHRVPLWCMPPPPPPGQLLRRVLLWRCRRASARAFGLSALAELYASLASSAAKRSVVLWLRPALRGALERDTAAPPAGTASAPPMLPGALAAAKVSDRPWTLRHHYLVHLEGCGAGVTDRVQAAFVGLYTALSESIATAGVAGDVALAACVLWTWGVTFEPADHEFILRAGVLPTLGGLMAVNNMLEDKAAALPAAPVAGAGASAGSAAAGAVCLVLSLRKRVRAPLLVEGRVLQAGGEERRVEGGWGWETRWLTASG
jgi:hypothetical protein